MGGGGNNDPCVRFKNVLRPFLLDGVFNVLHVGENKFPVVALESLHELQVAADLKTLDRFLLWIKKTKDSEEIATSHYSHASGHMGSSDISNILRCMHQIAGARL